MSNDQLALPPIGTPLEDLQGLAIDLATRLKRECMDVREMFIGWADLGRNYYHYGAPDPPDDELIIANDIQNFIIVQTDTQTKEPPSITLEAVDTEEPPDFYHNLPPKVAQKLGLQPQEYEPTTGPDGTMQPPAPLSPESVQLMQQAIAAQMIPQNSLIEMTVSETVDFFQKIFDVVWWNRSAPDEWFWDNTLLNNVDGWCPAIYEFDDDKKRNIITNCPIRQFFCDMTTYDVERMGWVMPDIVYRADVAKTLFPDFADQIDENATPPGRIERPPNTLLMGSQYEDVSSFQTSMVTLTVLFLRDQDCYMDSAKAVDSGMMEKRPVGTGNWNKTPPTDEDPEGGMEQEMRDGHFPPGGDEEFFPPGDKKFDPAKWPTYKCLRQLTMIAAHSILLSDEESGYWDIPIALNINVPVIGKPVGMGEPYRLKAMQNGRTRTLNSMVDHVGNYNRPFTWGPKSARELLPEEFKDSFEFGTHLWIDDETIAKSQGKPMGVENPPPLAPAHMAVDDKLKREMNDSGGNMAALQGQEEQTGQLSGVAIAQIQQGASSLASFKARRMTAVIKRLAHLAFHSVLTRMTPADYGKIIKRYPDHVLEALHAKGKDLEWSIKVSVAAGTGATIQTKKNDAKDNFQRGLISRKTTQERIGEDPALEEQRQQEEAAEMQQMQPQRQPAGAQR